MRLSESHVPLERLTAIALAGRASADPQDRHALKHVAHCPHCALELDHLKRTLASLREASWAEVDEAFGEEALESQRHRILDRIAHLGQAARVLRFPGRGREAAMPVSRVSRRWISVAAAAGLIIGLVAGQLIHLVPTEARLSRDRVVGAAPSGSRSAGPIIVQASTGGGLSDDELLGEVDEAVQLRRAAALRALDGLTPLVGELTEIR